MLNDQLDVFVDTTVTFFNGQQTLQQPVKEIIVGQLRSTCHEKLDTLW